MPIRLSGMSSGLDTEALVSALVSGYTVQKNNLVKAQTKLSWKQEKWSSMNTKIYSFYTGSLSTARFSKNYSLKKATISNSNYAAVEASTSAVTGTQKLKVNKLATAGYLTGGVISATTSDSSGNTSTSKVTGSTKLSEITGMGSGTSGSLQITAEGKTTNIKLSDDMTVNSLVSQLKSAGVNASFDETNQRFFISSKTSGTEHEFSLTGLNANGDTALSALGLKDTSIDNIDSIVAPYKSIANDSSYVENKVRNKYNSDVSSFNNNVASYLNKIKTATANIETETKKNDAANAYINTFLDNAKTSVTEAKAKLNQSLSDAQDAMTNATTDEEKAAAKIQLDAVNSVISLLNDDIKDEDYTTTAEELRSNINKQYNETSTSLNQTIKTNTDNITNMYSEAGFNSSDYEIDPTNGEIINISSSISDYIGADGKINTTNYTYEKAYDATAKTEGSTIYNYIESATAEKSYAENMVKSSEIVSAINEYNEATDKTSAIEKLKTLGVINNDTDSSQYDTILSSSYTESLKTLGVSSSTSSSGAKRVYGEDSEIELNGAKFTNNTNTYSINGLTITATALTGDNEITISTENDVDGIYDSIKSFISDYNSLIKEIDTAYNAASAKGYEPLTSDEKSAMTDDQIKEWEDKIKTSLLRRDSTLNSISSMMKTDMLKSYTINGKSYSLASFGIGTQSYFSSGENEKGVLHIDGDSDDSVSKSNEDKLKAALASDPDTVIEFFSKLSADLYTDLGKKMQRTSLSSSFTVYNDKEMAKEYSDYTTKISDKTTEISTWEDYYYKKFSSMESALASLNSQQSSLSGYFS